MEGRDYLVGRDAEVARISSFLADVPVGAAALHIVGEPGIGKTALWREGVARARERSIRALVTRPAEPDRDLSFGALDDLLREALPDIASQLSPPQQRALRTALLIEEPSGRPPELLAVAVATREAFKALARQGPIVIAVDDRQWLDGPSRAVLGHAMRRISDDPIGLLTTDRGRGATTAETTDSLPGDRVHTMELGPLPLGAIHRLVVERLGRSLPRPALVRVHEMAGGNPLFALEISRALLAQGGAVRPGDPFPVPDDLLTLLRSRLEGLGRQTQELLAVVALLTDRSISMIRRITPETVTSCLESALAADVLELDGESVRFTHPLLASAVTTRLLPDTIRSIHRRIGAVSSDPEERARHLALGAPGPDAAVAEALDDAAHYALRRGSASVAGELQELAARLTPTDDADARRNRLLDAARSLVLSGEMDRASQIGHQLLDGYLDTTQRIDTLLLLSELHLDDMDEGLRIADQAVAAAVGDRHRSTRALIARAGSHMMTGSIRDADPDARRAMSIAEHLQDAALLVRALTSVCLIETWTDRETPGLLDRAIALADGIEALPIYESPRFVRGLRLMCVDRLDEARSSLQVEFERVAASGDEVSRVGTLLHLAELECRAGNFDVALRHATEGAEASEQMGVEYQGGANLYVLALVHTYLGHVDEARSTAERGLALSTSIGDEIFRIQNASVLGFLEISLGEAAAAAAILRPLADRLEELGWAEPTVYRVLPNAIEALVATGDLDEARRLLTLLEARAAAGPLARAWAGRYRGLLLAAEGDPPGAVETLEEVRRAHDRFPGPFERARTLFALGSCQRRAKRKAPARGSLEEARDAFRTLGARLWVERAERELRRIGGRRASSLELTTSERRVAVLVEEGLTNREIADRLFVSVRTVEGHLSSAYRKLGVRSRTELAKKLGASTASGEREARSDPPLP